MRGLIQDTIIIYSILQYPMLIIYRIT